MNSNKLVIDVANNPEIRDYLSRKKAGETCTFEVEATLDEMVSDQAVFSVKSTDLVHEGGEEAAPEMPKEAMMRKSKGPEAVMVAFGGKSY